MQAMDGNTEMIDYLQEVFGYCLTESTAERCLFYLYGEGRTGKSTLLNVWRKIMGDYSQNMAPHSLVAQKYPGAINNDIARMQNVRMVTAIETDSDQSFSEALVKQLTGGTDMVSARFLYSEYFDFVPVAKIFVASNHLMGIKGSDEAVWDRIRLIPFNVRVAEDKQDKDLFEKLLKEKAGIFNWALEGHRRWQIRGALLHPQVMKIALAQYRAEVDVVGDFLAGACINSPNSDIVAGEIFDAFKAWCEQSCVEPVTKSAFGRYLKHKGYKSKRGTKGVRMWHGLQYISSDSKQGLKIVGKDVA